MRRDSAVQSRARARHQAIGSRVRRLSPTLAKLKLEQATQGRKDDLVLLPPCCGLASDDVLERGDQDLYATEVDQIRTLSKVGEALSA